jgi:hypothetical protein
MFEDIIDFPISISLISKINEKENLSIEIPDPNIIHSAESLWNMCLWLNNEFIIDCKKITFSKEGIPSFDSNWTERNTSRSISYSIHSCLIEGILWQLYKKTCSDITQFIDLKKEPNSIFLKEMEKEFKPIRNFRNKVAAHTVYEDPRKEDNPSDELASLSALTSVGWNNRDAESFNLGSVIRVVNGHTPKHENFQFSIKNSHKTMVLHLKKWNQMFLSLIDEAEKKLPINNQPYKNNGKEYLLTASIV